jgi:hypothetical protein
MSTEITFTPGVLGTECFATYQLMYNAMIERLSGTLPDASVKYIISDTAPTADDQDKLWIKTSSGAPIRPYKFYNGAWSWPHPVPNDENRIQIYKGTAASIDTLDGGTAGTPDEASGPFWAIDPDLSAKFLVGVGTLASGTAIAEGGTGGEENHTLVQAELPDHSHTFTVNEFNNWDSSNASAAQLLLGDQAIQTANSSTPDVSVSGGGSDEAHNNMPPYYGVYYIKRTARIYYTG